MLIKKCIVKLDTFSCSSVFFFLMLQLLLSIRYDEQVEEMLDEAYERYLIRRGGSTKQRKRAKQALSTGDTELIEVFNVLTITSSVYFLRHACLLYAVIFSSFYFFVLLSERPGFYLFSLHIMLI